MSKIEDVRNLNDPQRVYKWRISLPSFSFLDPRSVLDKFADKIPVFDSPFVNQVVDTQVRDRLSALNIPILSNRSFSPSFQVEEVQGVPFPNSAREEFYEAGKYTYFPSVETIQPFSIVFYQDASNKIPNYIMEWKRRVINNNGTKNLPSEYKMPINIQLLNGNNKITFDITLFGCFPLETTGYDLSNESKNLKLTQSFSVDRVHYNAVPNIADTLREAALGKLVNLGKGLLGTEALGPVKGFVEDKLKNLSEKVVGTTNKATKGIGDQINKIEIKKKGI